jgi:hypothetical protein
VQGLVVFLLGLALTSGALAMLSNLSARPPRAVEVAVLIFANLAATVLKIVLFREWVFAARRSAHTTSGTPTELETPR